MLLAAALASCGPGGDDGDLPVVAAGGAIVEAALPAGRAPPATPGRGEAGTGQGIERSRTTAIVRAAGRVSPAVVSVNVMRERRRGAGAFWERFFLPPGATRPAAGLGSGFIYDARGLVLTNEHVVRDAERIQVTLPDGRDMPAELVGADDRIDIAVLRIEGSDFPIAPLGRSDGLLIGEWSVAIGNPFGNLLSNLEPSVTAGVISATGRHIVPDGSDRGVYLDMIQTDASINPGNSGGPLVNALGEVIGVNSSIFSRSGGSEGLGFAIPIDRVLQVAEDLVEHGEFRRAWLGLSVEPLEADAWGRTRGVRVAQVGEGSPASRARIRVGTAIVEVNGRRLATPLDFDAALLAVRAGEEVILRIGEGGRTVRVSTAELPSLGAPRVSVFDEMEVATVTPPIRSERGLVSESGAIILSISQEFRARLGLREGDVMTRINDTVTKTAEEAARALRRAAGSGMVQIHFERERGRVVHRFPWR